MQNAKRNRILTMSAFTLYTALWAAISWIIVALSRRDHLWIVVASLAVPWVYFCWTYIREMREIERAERTLEADGIELPDEEPIPIKVAAIRESLVASLIALTLIALTFAAYFGGWLGHGRE